MEPPRACGGGSGSTRATDDGPSRARSAVAARRVPAAGPCPAGRSARGGGASWPLSGSIRRPSTSAGGTQPTPRSACRQPVPRPGPQPGARWPASRRGRPRRRGVPPDRTGRPGSARAAAPDAVAISPPVVDGPRAHGQRADRPLDPARAARRAPVPAGAGGAIASVRGWLAQSGGVAMTAAHRVAALGRWLAPGRHLARRAATARAAAGPSRRRGRAPRPRVGRAGASAGGPIARPPEELGEPALRLEVAPDHHRVVRLERLGHPVDQRPREPQRVAHLAHRRPRPVRDEVADHPRVLRPVALVDVLDDLLAARRAEVDVDVRVGRPALVDEPLEQQLVADRVDAGDPEHVRRRSSSPRSPGPGPGCPARFANRIRSQQMRKNSARPVRSMTSSSWASCLTTAEVIGW